MRLLNEDAVNKVNSILTPHLSACYLHVDDTVVVSSGDSLLPAKEIMEILANSFEEWGLEVPEHEQKGPDEIDKIIGYEVSSMPARLSLP